MAGPLIFLNNKKTDFLVVQTKTNSQETLDFALNKLSPLILP